MSEMEGLTDAEYKATIDVTPNGWINQSVGTFLQLTSGKSKIKSDLVAQKGEKLIPVYGGNGINGYCDEVLINDPTVVIGRVGEYCGCVHITIDKSWITDNALYIRKLNNGYDLGYVYQLLVFSQLNKLRKETGQPLVSQQPIYDLSVLTPPLPEQQKIAQILTSVDEVIEKTQAQIDKLKDLKTAMMQELLTQGVCDENGKRHVEFKDSPVGRIPVGWEVSAIGSLAKLTSGGTPNREMPNYWGGNIAWVKTGEIKYATIYKTEEYITEKGLKESSAKIIPPGSVLMAMYGQGITRGRVAILGIAAAMNQACLAMIPNERVNNVFLYYFLTNEYGNLRSLVQEGAQKNLNATIVKDFLMPVPPVSEQQKIVRILSSIDTKLEITNKKSNSLNNTKKALMQDLLTGKVRVNLDAQHNDQNSSASRTLTHAALAVS
jgi:type I restriction enzyme S subunit